MKKFPSYYRTLFFILLLLVTPQIHEAQNVLVPAKDKGKTSPLVFNASTTNAGKALYEVNCQSCHGNPRKGNYLRGLNPPPADLGSEQAQNQTDGELFYRISEGNPIMPKFKATLSENERWELVSFIRSFNKNYVQSALQNIAGNVKGKAVHVGMSYDPRSGRVFILARAVVKKDTIPLKGSSVMLFVKRYFGKLQIGNATKTNDKGIAVIDFPENIPGDKEGNLNLISRINDDVYGEIITNQKLKIGVHINNPGLTAKRAMWNVEAKAPVWILSTFFSILGTVLLAIVYISYNIYRIKQQSKNIKE